MFLDNLFLEDNIAPPPQPQQQPQPDPNQQQAAPAPAPQPAPAAPAPDPNMAAPQPMPPADPNAVQPQAPMPDPNAQPAPAPVAPQPDPNQQVSPPAQDPNMTQSSAQPMPPADPNAAPQPATSAPTPAPAPEAPIDPNAGQPPVETPPAPQPEPTEDTKPQEPVRNPQEDASSNEVNETEENEEDDYLYDDTNVEDSLDGVLDDLKDDSDDAISPEDDADAEVDSEIVNDIDNEDFNNLDDIDENEDLDNPPTEEAPAPEAPVDNAPVQPEAEAPLTDEPAFPEENPEEGNLPENYEDGSGSSPEPDADTQFIDENERVAEDEGLLGGQETPAENIADATGTENTDTNPASETEVQSQTSEDQLGVEDPNTPYDKMNAEQKAEIAENAYFYVNSILNKDNQKIKPGNRATIYLECDGIVDKMDIDEVIQRIRGNEKLNQQDKNIIDAFKDLKAAKDKYDLYMRWSPKKKLEIIGNKVGKIYNTKYIFNNIEYDNYEAETKDEDKMDSVNPLDHDLVDSWKDGSRANRNSDMNPIMDPENNNDLHSKLSDELKSEAFLEKWNEKIRVLKEDEEIDDIIDELAEDIENDGEFEDDLLVAGDYGANNINVSEVAETISEDNTDRENFIKSGVMKAYLEKYNILSNNEKQLIENFNLVSEETVNKIMNNLLISEENVINGLKYAYNKNLHIFKEEKEVVDNKKEEKNTSVSDKVERLKAKLKAKEIEFMKAKNKAQKELIKHEIEKLKEEIKVEKGKVKAKTTSNLKKKIEEKEVLDEGYRFGKAATVRRNDLVKQGIANKPTGVRSGKWQKINKSPKPTSRGYPNGRQPAATAQNGGVGGSNIKSNTRNGKRDEALQKTAEKNTMANKENQVGVNP